MAEQVVTTIVEKLSGVAINELLLLRGVRSDMQYITAHLNMMRAYLRRAEEKPEMERDDAARTWAQVVQELAYDAEDCIDEFRLHLGQPTPHGLAGTLQRLTRFVCTLKACHRIARQIQDIKSRVKHAKEMRSLYGLGESTLSIDPTSNITVSTSLDPRMAALFVEEAELVGMDEPRKELIRWLKEKNKPQLGVISVVGMGGLGKTTLVRKVYESRKLSQLFNCRAWITVSKIPIEGVLEDMILQLQIPEQKVKSILQSDSPFRRNRLIEKLREHLEDKRYLIVFDDIWINSAWENIKFALPDSRNGSRVIVTTRIATIASTCCSFFPPYILQPLSHEQSWELFCKRVFKDTWGSCSLELEDLCRAVLKKCNGLPLAIVTIAGLLASKPNKTREEWQRVHDHLGSELETNPGLEGVKQILELSYDDLPYDLKPCFLYLSKYPEDYEIKRRKVVKLWVAEGFARGTQDMSAEEVADGYFDEFINRSMIQPSKIGWDGKAKSGRVHDIYDA